MATKAKSPIPAGYHTVTPYLIVKGAAEAIEWYKKTLGAEEKMRMPGPGGKVMHAELDFGGSVVMLADEMPEMGAKSPQTLGGTPAGMMYYVKDVDTVFKKAISAGAKVEREVQDQFYGDRSGTFVDPFGHKWTVGTHTEDMTPQEMQQRMQEFMAKQK